MYSLKSYGIQIIMIISDSGSRQHNQINYDEYTGCFDNYNVPIKTFQ